MFIKETPGRTAIHNEDFCSIALVSYNRFDFLHQLIDSIHEHADMPFELIVSDDGGEIYTDFNFIKELKPKITRMAINLGPNTGLHVNANNAVSLCRSKYVILINDDIKMLSPFMRKSVNVLKHTPYISGICLNSAAPLCIDGNYSQSKGFIHCKTPDNQHYHLFCADGGSWAVAFRKSYWQIVDGYSEDSMYGDAPFLSKGHVLGYFSALLENPEPFAIDMDKDIQGLTHASSGRFSHNKFCNYPKIFGWTATQHSQNSLLRQQEIGHRETEKRALPDLNEFSWKWQTDYMCKVSDGTKIDLEYVKKFHNKFLTQIKKDIL